MRKPFSAVAALLVLSLSSLGCVVETGGHAPPHRAVHHPGPPPHAPAHGYRHKHKGGDLVFDSAIGVYVAVDLRDVWFLDGSYFRIVGERWEIAVSAGGPWRAAAYDRVPARLYEKRHPHGGPPGQSKKKDKHQH